MLRLPIFGGECQWAHFGAGGGTPNPPFFALAESKLILALFYSGRNSTVRVGVTALDVEFFGANAPSADLLWSVEGKAHLGRRPATVGLAPRLFQFIRDMISHRAYLGRGRRSWNPGVAPARGFLASVLHGFRFFS